MVGGRGGSAKSDFISKGAVIKHLMRGEGESKKGENHLTSYMDGPLPTLTTKFEAQLISIFEEKKRDLICVAKSAGDNLRL